MKQQQLSVRRKSDRQQSSQYSFLLSGFSDHEKTTLARQIIRLGGKYLDCKEFSPECTHVVCIRPMRSEKFLCGCASGRWVVSPDYIHDSTAAGRWLEEASYVWDNETSEDSNISITSASMVNAPKRWREHLEMKNQRAFEGWNVAILVTNTKNRPAVYRRLIECGGGNVMSLRSSSKNLESLTKTLNYIFMDKCYLEKVRPLLAEGVPCLAPDFIAEYLFQESPDLEKYDIRTFEPNQNKRGSLVNSLSSTAGSCASSPLKGCSVSLGPSTPRITTPLKTSTNAVKPKRYRQSQLPASLFTQSSQSSPSQSQTSDSQSQSPQASSKHRSPLTKSPQTPSLTQTTLKRTPLTRSKTPGGPGTFVKQTTKSNDPGVSVKSETVVNRKLFSSHQVQKTVEEVQKKYSPAYYSRVPYWIQVKPPKYQDHEEMTMPFPTMVCNLIDAYLEEGLWLRAVESIHSYLSVKKYPPSSLLHVIMSKVLEWKDVAFTSQAINLLKSVLCVHRPSTPEMSQVYLDSFVPSDNDMFGLESDDPINTPWDFVGSVIRKSLQLPLGDSEEDIQEQEQAQNSVLRNNHQMLLSYIVALVEQDFQVWVHRQGNATTKEQKSCHCMLSSILWPDGNVKASGPFATQLISFMLQAVAAIGSASHMYPCLRMIISLVEMAAETCRVITGDSSILGHAETGVHLDFAAEIASMLSQEGLMENMESLNVLLSLLRPDWLKLKVVESLLCAYDDSLVREEFRDLVAQPLSLKKVVNYYFYLLPLMTTASLHPKTPEKPSQAVITKSRKRPHQDTVQAGPLKTLAVKNNIRNLQTLQDRPNIKAPKTKINKVNRRNMRGETPLHLACIKNNVAKVRELLSNPAIEINQVDFAGWTALHEASNHGHVDCVKELLKYKPKATIASYFSPGKDKKSANGLNLLAAPAECGTTPLHDTVNNHHVEVARLLVKAGGKAVLMARNKAGFTPLDLTADNAMRRALVLSTDTKSEPSMPGKDHNKENVMESDSQEVPQSSTPSPPSRQLRDIGIPSEEEYTCVLGSSSGPKVYIPAERCEQLCLLVCHLLRSCLRVHKLVPIKADLDSQHGSIIGFDLNLNETSDAGSCKAYSQTSVHYEMMTSVSNEGAFQQSSLRFSGSRLLDDLTEMCRLDSHIDGFVHHIGRIGPWVGSQRSKICNKVVCELKAVVLTCL
ncbi:SMC5-SMC6 complex localization factor protein 1-like isoform X1 [Asterias amurensis]|uniref:SMC5-SMC6 complex localization factor protein 1-like isoform X1 n=1 Tax=Asterias amurensis TaxID=7602 RepID=UPI003AB8545A